MFLVIFKQYWIKFRRAQRQRTNLDRLQMPGKQNILLIFLKSSREVWTPLKNWLKQYFYRVCHVRHLWNSNVPAQTHYTVWTVNDVSVDPYPFHSIKMVWIDRNKKRYGSTKTSLTVHNCMLCLITQMETFLSPNFNL